MKKITAEEKRLAEHYGGKKKWMKWGPYLSERQWGTVREDYSPDGSAWHFFPHDHARSRVYRWGEDGLAGISDNMQRMCFAVALWNGQDAILKERVFGLAGPEGNHGEDCKDLYYYLDSTPTHTYMKHLYKYPQAAYPYADIVNENRMRGFDRAEYEVTDTGVFNNGKYFDVFTEYAKADEEDILIRISIHNRSDTAAPVWLLPTLWYRNLWSFGLLDTKPEIVLEKGGKGWQAASCVHPELGQYWLAFATADKVLFTENETHAAKLFGHASAHEPFVKDAFHRAVVGNDYDFLADKTSGTKLSPLYKREVPALGSIEIKLRLCNTKPTATSLGAEFDKIFAERIADADQFYQAIQPTTADDDLRNIQRQAYAGMLWSKQYYNIDIPRWLDGDPNMPPPPEERKKGRNAQWNTLNNEDIVSMPDKWEYPWYAAWDLAFHCIPLAKLDADFAKEQLILLLREWYMHPNGQLPAYEWAFADVNPPVHAWACLEVYRIDAEKKGKKDVDFLKRVFQKLLINFTWWVNRKDSKGHNVFEGGFLGLDNIGIFDRSNAIPGGGVLEQADGTAWMGMYSLNMLEMALEISIQDPTYEDVTTKFFEHFVYIAASLNRLSADWTGAWDEDEGFFFDILELPGDTYIPLKIKSLVGLTTVFAVLTMQREMLDKLTDFERRLKWFQNYRKENDQYLVIEELKSNHSILLSLIPKARLKRLLSVMMDEREFLSTGGIRSLSKIHEKRYSLRIAGKEFGLEYTPGESTTSLFGGNSNWRGPVWMPMNYLIVSALRKYHIYYGNDLQVEMPKGSGNFVNTLEAAHLLTERLISIFRKDGSGKRPIHDNEALYSNDKHFQDLVLFYEYFHGDTGRGVGATHQTGWTGLVASLIDQYCNDLL